MNLSELNPNNVKLISEIAKNYNPLNYNSQLVDLLKIVYPSENFGDFCKYQLHKLVNNTLMNYYNGERLLKYELFNLNCKKDIVGAFEIKVNNSRVDFLTINGSTNSFEIKSSLDNLGKLSKQSTDYLKAFEYNCLVVDDRHIANAIDMVPESFGIWSFSSGRKKIYRKATLNNKIDPEIQVTLLSKKELITNFSEVQGSAKAITSSFAPNIINKRFKIALKNRYLQKWKFLVSHHASILPIDLQFFFKTGIPPEYIYHH